MPAARVARVGERLLLPGRALPVDAGELGARHVDLAARLEQRRRLAGVQTQRQTADRLQVVRHVVAALAIAAGGADGEAAVS